MCEVHICVMITYVSDGFYLQGQFHIDNINIYYMISE
jgi:hypothetical protein